MNNKKYILNLDQLRDILQICPKVGNKKFEEPSLEKEILAFLASLGHSGEIRKITNVNVNKLHQPWRSFDAIINKCLSGKPSYDSLRLSQAQILWGMYNNKKVDYAYLMWEDFTYQIENKNTKKGNAMYYPRFTNLIVNFVMAKDPLSQWITKPSISSKQTEAEQLRNHQESRKETHSSNASRSLEQMKGTGVSPDDEDSDNEVEGMVLKGEKSDEDATINIRRTKEMRRSKMTNAKA
ncbi:hypothetical protein Tco_1216965 [Tanacetum coccineum]